jgi:hypothetical protein
MGPVGRGNWGSSVAATNLAINWEENGLPQDAIWDIKKLWSSDFGFTDTDIPEWARQFIVGTPFDDYKNNPNYIVDETTGAVFEKNEQGGRGQQVLHWDWDRLLASPEFLSYLASTDYGYNYAQS